MRQVNTSDVYRYIHKIHAAHCTYQANWAQFCPDHPKDCECSGHSRNSHCLWFGPKFGDMALVAWVCSDYTWPGFSPHLCLYSVSRYAMATSSYFDFLSLCIFPVLRETVAVLIRWGHARICILCERSWINRMRSLFDLVCAHLTDVNSCEVMANQAETVWNVLTAVCWDVL